MGHELKQKPVPVDEDSSSSDQELGEGLLLESLDNPWMRHVSYIMYCILHISMFSLLTNFTIFSSMLPTFIIFNTIAAILSKIYLSYEVGVYEFCQNLYNNYLLYTVF